MTEIPSEYPNERVWFDEETDELVISFSPDAPQEDVDFFENLLRLAQDEREGKLGNLGTSTE